MKEIYCALVIYLSAIAYFAYEIGNMIAEVFINLAGVLTNLPIR